MSWYPPGTGHPGGPQVPPPQSQFQHQVVPPTTSQHQVPQVPYNNQQWQNQSQQPHQQPVNYHPSQTGNFMPQQQPPLPSDASWNTPNHASNYFKPADINQNFAAPPNQPPAMAQPPPQPTQQNDGWGDWGDEWAGEAGATATTASANVNNNTPMALENHFNQQLPPPAPTNQHQSNFNDNAFYPNQNQLPTQSLYTAPANYPPPPSVANYDQNAEQDHQQTPQQQFNPNVIADSFASSDSWNWNSGAAAGTVDSNANNVELIRKPAVFNKMSTNAIEKLATTESYNTNQPDDMKSQNYGQQAMATTEDRQPRMNQQSDDLDPLDMALMQMNVQQQQFSGVPDNTPNFFGTQPNPLPPTFQGGISLPNQSARVENQVQDVIEEVSEAVPVESTPIVSSTAPPLPVPAVEVAPVSVLPPPPSASIPPPTMSTMPPPPAQSNAAGNPFKRSGAAVHRNLQFHSAPAASTNVITPIPAPTPPLQQTHTSIPHNNNDRNAYLQTDQLSEDVVHNVTNTSDVPPMESFDTLPPPGLSRLVLGETEDQHSANVAVSQPSVVMPGLNRMIPGTDLENAAADMALQREADGQDDDDVTQAMNYPPVPSDLTDRNLYRVPGESHQDQQQQQQPPPSRVVTGDENTVPFTAAPAVELSVPMSSPAHLPVEELRDLQPVDGENSCDDDNVRFNRQHGEMLDREEPIEGENAGDADVVISSGGAAAAAAASVASGVNEIQPDVSGISMPIDGGSLPSSNLNTRKETSTGEESDRERASYYKSKSGRDRDVDTGSLRRKAKPKERYDSESDNSDQRREQRRPYDRSYVSEKSRGEDRRHRKGMDESSRGHNRTDRGERRHGEAEYDRNYGRGGEERRSKRYYDDERDEAMPRRRATDENAKRADKERQYRKDRDRDREDRRGEYRDRDEKDLRHRGGGGGGGYSNREKDPRRYDYDDERYNRSGSRNTDRSRDPRYANSGGGYYGPSYGYDHYAYYTQQQQQQMQYYENLRRTNPQAYAEWYRKYYMQASAMGGAAGVTMTGGVPPGGISTAGGLGQQEMPTDGRESVHSGRSSTNGKDRYHPMNMSTGYYPYGDYHRGGAGAGAQLETSMMDSSYGPASMMSSLSYSHSYAQYPSQGATTAAAHRTQVYTPSGGHHQQPTFYSQRDFSDSRQQLEKDANRMTPFKFTNEHGQVSLCNGLVVCIKPKYSQTGVHNLVKIINVGALRSEYDAEKRLLAVYPGPLVRGVTHKKTVIEFCEERLKHGQFGTVAAHTRENSLLRSHANSMTSLCSVTQHSGQQSSSQQQQQHQPFKASYNLLWNLLILLLRQNGTVVGTDIAELLIKNATDFPTTNSNLVILETTAEVEKPAAAAPPLTTTAADGGDASLSDINSDESNEEGLQPLAQSLSTKASNLSEEQITDKFRNYLLYGNVSEALDWATEHNLWGHALFLASKMDRRSHSNVMMKFANKLSLNDPLQTLYQLMSLRMPSFVTSVVDRKWGDWRPHLAMILSNTSQKPDLDRRAITTLGDSLAHIGDVYGSHFCYLMAQVGFGKYEPEGTVSSASSPKLVLLGSSSARPFKEFATTEAILMTEIYEYAVTLNDESYMIGEYQPYKFTLATRLLDYGHQLKAFLYMEQLAKNIKRDPQKFEYSLVNNVYTFADRLRYYDPVQEKTVDASDSQDSEGDHQKWIQELKEATMMGQFDQSRLNGDPQQQQQQEMDRRGSSIDRQFSEINQQFNQLNLQYQSYDQSQQQQQQPEQHQTDYYEQPDQQQSQYLQPDYSQRETGTDSVPAAEVAANSEGNQYDAYGYQQQPFQQPPTMGNFYNPANYGTENGGGYDQPSMGGDQQQLQQDTTAGGYDYFGQQQQQQQQTPTEPQMKELSATTRPTTATTNKTATQKRTVHQSDPSSLSQTDHPHPLLHNGGESVLGGVGGLGNRKIKLEKPPMKTSEDWPATTTTSENDYEPPRPQISMPSSMSHRAGFYDDDAGANKANGGQQQAKQAAGKAASKDKTLPTGGKGNEQSGGWFGGIWGKLSLKPKNQMILPDDKNPSIVWDPDNKRWINTDEGEAESEAFKPPPKMSELNLPQQPMGQPQMQGMAMQSQGMPPPSFTTTPAPVPTPIAPTPMMSLPQGVQPMAGGEDVSAIDGANRHNNLQSNQFKLQRNRTLKKSYVDVFNPSGAPMKADNIMAPSTVPQIPQGGFFVPGAAPMGQPQNFN